jgi:nucleolar protein 56
MHALIESSVGYSLFKLASKIDTATLTPQTALNSLKLAAFLPFTSASNALDNILAVSEGIVSPALASFLDLSLTKEKDLVLAVGDANLAGNIKAQLGYLTLIIGKLKCNKRFECEVNDYTREVLRSIRTYFPQLMAQLKDGDIDRAQLGLGHSYSRSKVWEFVPKADFRGEVLPSCRRQ